MLVHRCLIVILSLAFAPSFTTSSVQAAETSDRTVSTIAGKKIEVVEQASNGDLVSDAVTKLVGRPATGLRVLLEANKKQILAAARGQTN